jgi:periplasmic divalent cation tolerance protein
VGAPARIVLVTHPPRGAAAFARTLVERRLAACVNLVPLSSVYRWRERVERAREVLLLVKSTAGRLHALERHVRDEHPYECPEFVVLEPRHVAKGYLRWLVEETR